MTRDQLISKLCALHDKGRDEDAMAGFWDLFATHTTTFVDALRSLVPAKTAAKPDMSKEKTAGDAPRHLTPSEAAAWAAGFNAATVGPKGSRVDNT